MKLLSHRRALLASTLLCAVALPARAQNADDYGEEEEIVVAGQKPRGSVIGDYQPELTLNAGDVRALGVSSITELLEELAPQVESAGGGRPVVLLEGRRVASFREIGPIPTEAIARVEILPEEVALKYGYSATQKVVNIVLRQRFRAFTAEAGGKLGTHGDGAGVTTRGGFLAIRRGERTNIDIDYGQTAAITERDRGLASGGSDRTLTPDTQALRVTGTWAKPLSNVWLATLNAELTTSDSRSLRGSALSPVTIPGGSPFSMSPADTVFQPLLGGALPLRNTRAAQGAHAGLTLNGTTSDWQWTVTGNYDAGWSRNVSQRPLDLSRYAAAVAAGDPLADPALPLDPLFVVDRPADHTRNRTSDADVNLVATVSPLRLPAGAVTTTLRAGGSSSRSSGTVFRSGFGQAVRVARDQGEASFNVDVPLSSAAVPLFPGAGRLSVNANAAIREVGDFGTLRTWGGGLNWNPLGQLSLIAAYRDDQGAPTAAQLGEAVATTTDFDLFDYTRGESVRVVALTGGNPDLGRTSLRNLRIGASFRLTDPNIVLNLDYNRTRQRGQVMALPGATPAVVAAFPERFTRDAQGMLTAVDLRPINIASQDTEKLRWGLTFTKSLKTPQSQIDAMRESFQRRFPGGFPGRGGGGDGRSQAGAEGGPPVEGDAGAANPGGSGGGGERGGRRGQGGLGGGFGGPRGGGGGGSRLTLSVFHTWVFADRARLRAGEPEIDLLDGGTIGAASGGSSRHRIEAQAGFSQSGYGLRLNGDWRSATRVDGIAGYPATTLAFDDFATLDLRLFADLGRQVKLVEKAPFLRGARITFAVNNLFDARQRVRDGDGVTPFAYQRYYLDPVGRSFQLTFRKVFFSRPGR